MSLAKTLLQRSRQFGMRRSVAVYLAIVVGLVLASELAIEHMIGKGSAEPVAPLLNAAAIAALVANRSATTAGRRCARSRTSSWRRRPQHATAPSSAATRP